MRKIEILNKNYETVGLFVTLVNGKNYKDLFDAFGSTADDTDLQGIATDNNVSLYQVKYWYDAYLYMRYQILKEGKTYNKTGPSKYDVAYVNKTIDERFDDLNGYSLKEVFEEGDLVTQNQLTYIPQNGTMIDNSYYEKDTTAERYAEIKITTGINSSDNLYLIYNYKNLNNRWIDFYAFNLNGIYEGAKLDSSNDVDKTLGVNYQLPSDIGVSKDLRIRYSPKISQYSSTIYTGVLDYKIYDVYLPKVYNLNTFGISPTIDLYHYYSLYEARKDVSKKVLTYADIFEGEYSLTNPQPVVQQGITNQVIDINDNGHWEVKGDKTETYFRLKFPYNDLLNYDEEIYFNSSFNIFGSSSTSRTLLQRLLAGGPEVILYDETIQNNTLVKLSGIVENGSLNSIYFLNNSTFISDKINVLLRLYSVKVSIFDENITVEHLDLLLSSYLEVKDIVIIPEHYLPTTPTGFGNKYSFSELDNKIYDHELDFESMQLNILFGLYKNAYDSFNLMMRFLTSNEAIIAYDWGKGVRYTDVRLSAAPKTELESGQILKSKFEFKRSNPFYELVEENSQLSLKNDTQLPIPLKITIDDITADIVEIELENNVTGDIDFHIKFDFSELAITPEQVVIDSENKKVLIDGENIGYQYLVLGDGKNTFISIPNDSDTYVAYATGTDKLIFNYKKWVID